MTGFASRVLFLALAFASGSCRDRSLPGEPLPPQPEPARAAGDAASTVDPKAAPPGSRVDPTLLTALTRLTACNYRDGVFDYQCPAWRALRTLLPQRERVNRALVQRTLLGLLQHREERVRLAAAKHLAGHVEQDGVVKVLVQRYAIERSLHVRRWLVRILRPSGAGLDVVLRAVGSDPAPRVRAQAAKRLELTDPPGRPRAAEALRRALQTDRSMDVRRQAAAALGAVQQDRVTEARLVACLADPQIGPHCSLGLGRIGGKVGYEAVKARVHTDTRRGTLDPLVLWGLMAFAGRPVFRPGEILECLQTVAESSRLDGPARHYAVKSLGRLVRSAPELREEVRRVLERLRNVRGLAAAVRSTLAQLGSPAATQP